MDVRCNRCATEYDFDDALISERGTTVKCTNCGYQFKIFPASAGGAPERWVVRTSAGREIVFTSLGDLQRGITENRVGPNDLLSRGKQPPRPLGSIAELEQFFTAAPRASERAQRTLHGVAPPPGPASGPATPAPTPVVVTQASTGSSEPVTREPASLGATLPGSNRHATARFGTMQSRTPGDHDAVEPTLRATEHAVTTPRSAPEPMPSPPPAPVISAQPPVVHTGPQVMPGFATTLTSAGVVPNAPPRVGSQPDLGSNGEAVRSSPRSSGPFTAPPPSTRSHLRSYDELPAEVLPDPARRARSRWIAAVVIVGVATLLAVTLGRRYLTESRALSSGATAESNTRVAALLRDGNRLAEEGDLEGASDALLKASALAEKDPAVLAARAKLETLRADLSWLKLRLLDPSVSELVQATHRELGRRVGKARAAADAAFAVAPEDLAVLRARVDVLRLSGEADQAREWIKPIASQPSDPSNAYVLAALDLAEAEPAWPGVIDRLRTASSAERSPGRAHAALVYALTRAGRLAEAEAELAKLDTSPNTGMLNDDLKSFVKRHHVAGDAAPAARPAALDPTKLGKLDTTASEEPRVPSGDFRRLLEQAAQALGRGDAARAERLYQQVLAQQPNNTEALAGLGDVAKRKNDPAAAAKMYDRVLAENPSYLPALLASADNKWESGDRKGARVLYRRIVDQAGATSEYGRRAASRLAEPEGEPEKPEQKPSEEPAPAPPPAAEKPEIDTTDLPENP